MVVSPDPFLDECFIKKPLLKKKLLKNLLRNPHKDLEIDSLINLSAHDLSSKNNDNNTILDNINNENDKKNSFSQEPIDLEVSFEKPLENDTRIQ